MNGFSRFQRLPLLVAISLILCTFPACAREASSGEAAQREMAEATVAAVPPAADAAAPDAVAPGAPTAVALPSARMVVSEATIEVRAGEPESVATAATRVVSESGGYVARSEADRTEDTVRSVRLVLRVPSDRFTESLSSLKVLGSVLREDIGTQDITEEYADLEATLRAKRALEERYLAMLGSAHQVKDMLEVERELGRVRTDIERIEGRTRLLSHQAALATIHFTAFSPDQPVGAEAEAWTSKLENAFEQAASLTLETTAFIIAVAGALLPLSLLGLAGFWLVRRLLRMRARMQAVDAG